jgi:hypothetical protein
MASAQEESRAVIVDQGGVEAIVGAMKIYPNAVDIQSGGCLALAGVLTPPFSSAVKSVSSRFVNEWNGISLVFRAMDKWPIDSAMQEVAFCLLCRLMLDWEAKLKLIDQGAMNKVDKVLKNFPSDERIKSQTTPFMNLMLKAMMFSKTNSNSLRMTSCRSVRFDLPVMET